MRSKGLRVAGTFMVGRPLVRISCEARDHGPADHYPHERLLSSRGVLPIFMVAPMASGRTVLTGAEE